MIRHWVRLSDEPNIFPPASSQRYCIPKRPSQTSQKLMPLICKQWNPNAIPSINDGKGYCLVLPPVRAYDEQVGAWRGREGWNHWGGGGGIGGRGGGGGGCVPAMRWHVHKQWSMKSDLWVTWHFYLPQPHIYLSSAPPNTNLSSLPKTLLLRKA